MHAVCQNTYDCKSISAIDIGWSHIPAPVNILSICGPGCPLSKLPAKPKLSAGGILDGRGRGVYRKCAEHIMNVREHFVDVIDCRILWSAAYTGFARNGLWSVC